MSNFDQSKNFSELLTEAMELRSLNVEKLAELTDIPIHYLVALCDGDFSKLPAIPYVHGYLTKISQVLKIDHNLLWVVYKREASLKHTKTSGPLDRLPSNRFALKPTHRKRPLIIGGIVLLIILIYAIWQLDNFIGTPKITIINPAADSIVVNTPSFKLIGETNPKDKLTINGEEILIEKNGHFEKDFSLQPGINTIEFKVKRFLGKEAKVIKQVIYQPQ